MRTQRGFTLIELMIVVVIVAILAAVAVPSYRNHIVKSNRAAAQSFMLQAANREEQIMLDMRNYAAVASNADFPNAPTNASPGVNLPVPDSVSKFYNLSIATGTGTYTVSAAPKGSQQTDDTSCGTLTLTQAGTKGPSTSGCW
ncbi:MAG: type IV pilin protein [Gallionellaceae bacterium]|jgi:type IV pilus assembly protein PilE